MLRITKLVLRGFKSFKKVDLTFPSNYMAIAGPNGSGKSNISDALRFVFGEMSLRSIRARRIRDLINTGCHKASVTVVLTQESGEEIEIRRAIREDGKMLYKCNGERSTRNQVKDLLAKHGFTLGAHNIMAQGEVQKLIDMNARQKREMIEEVAGIAEYEAKKVEAMRELERVEQKISEANVLLGEREGYMKELEKEKVAAERYVEFSKRMKNSRATLLKREVKTLETNYEKTCTELAALQQEDAKLAKEQEALEKAVRAIEEEKSKVVDRLNAWSKRDGDVKQLEEMKSRAETCGILAAEKAKELQALGEKTRALAGARKELEEKLKLAKDSHAAAKSEFDKLKVGMGQGTKAEAKALIDSKISLEVEKGRLEEIISRGTEVVEKLESGGYSGKKKDHERAKADIARGEKELDSLFGRERECAKLVPELEKRMLEIREKLVSSSYPEVFKVIDELKQTDKGIYGRVAELIEYQKQHAIAIDAGLGNRLNYVVVDDLETAQETIDTIKKRCQGRVTFIPLADLGPGKAQATVAGGAGAAKATRLIEVVGFDPKYRKAMELAFGDTLLVEPSFARQNFGKYRMVTLQGELYEHGFLSGGNARSNLRFADAAKLQEEEKRLRAERSDAYASLEAIRIEMGKLRKSKITSEIQLKSLEIELNSLKGMEEEGQALGKRISESRGRLGEVEKELASCNSRLGKLDQDRKVEEGVAGRFNELGAQIKVLENELAHLQESLKFNSAEAAGLGNSRAQAEKEIGKLEEEKKDRLEKAQVIEARLREASKDMEKLFEKSKELEKDMTAQGVKLGKLRYAREGLGKKQTDLSVAKASGETRLVDMKSELEGMRDVEELEGSKEELTSAIRECEHELNSLGTVNLKAPELYEEKAKSVLEIRDKTEKLANEKNAVMGMMQEIDKKKYDIFMNAFIAINDKFQGLCARIFRDKCHLMLDKPMKPFESGLQIKVMQEDGKERMVEMFSGGEKALMAILLIFAIQLVKPSPAYIMDEADAALDKENSKRFAELIAQLSERSQFIVITHNDTLISRADLAIGVSKTSMGSKIVALEMSQKSQVKAKTAGSGT